MANNISEKPDRWVIVKFKNEETYYKVFASWASGYLDGDRWKMNSGITRVEEDDTHYYFYGYSGSCYACHKNAYGVSTAYCQNVLDSVLANSYKVNTQTTLLPIDTNWMETLNPKSE